jgi:hypothetical protein
MNGKTLFYNEKKAERVNTYQRHLQEKLNKSVKCRTVKEDRMKSEIDVIASAYVNLNCKKCGQCIQVKFKEWQNGNNGTICRKCKENQIRNDLNNICNQVQPVLPYGYVIHQRGIDNQLIIRKKE